MTDKRLLSNYPDLSIGNGVDYLKAFYRFVKAFNKVMIHLYNSGDLINLEK